MVPLKLNYVCMYVYVYIHLLLCTILHQKWYVHVREEHTIRYLNCLYYVCDRICENPTFDHAYVQFTNLNKQ